MRRFLLVVLILLLPWLAGCQGQDAYTIGLILSGQHRYDQGHYLIGDLYVFGGQLHVAEGATLTGSVNMLAGDVVIDGAVEGEITALGGRLTLGPQATVRGPVNVAGAELVRAPGAAVAGTITLNSGEVPWDELSVERSWSSVLLQTLFSALAAGGLAHLTANLAPRPVSRVSRAQRRYPLVALATGMLVLVVLPALLVMMAFTMVLIPLVVLAGLALLLVILYGWMGLGMLVGQRLLRIWGRFDRPAWATGVGTATVVMAINLLALIPVGGVVVLLIAVALALGAVLLTRLGLHTFVPAVDDRPADLDSYRPRPVVSG